MTAISLDMEQLSRICAATEPAANPQILLQGVNDASANHDFGLTYTEEGWYRIGGVVTSEGQRVANNLEDWIEAESGGDIIDLVARYGDKGYCTTALAGKTHYLTATTGQNPLDFIQLEVEEIQEVMDHELFNPDRIPDTIEDIVDPLEINEVEPTPVSAAKYEFKQATHFTDMAEELTSDFTGDPAFRRFISDWNDSSAGSAIAFHQCWAVNVLPILKNVGEHKFEIKLLSPHADVIHAYDMSGMGSWGTIIKMLESLDNEAGFPMAWYFLMLTKKFMSYSMVKSIREEMSWSKTDYSFLAENDRLVLENWLDEPYNL